MDPEDIKSYSEYYQQYTKRKAKKLANAIELADECLRLRA